MFSRSPASLVFVSLALLCQHLAGQDLKQEPGEVGEVFASDASVQGSVVFASGGARLVSGSTVSAGSAAALVRLKRGGEVRVCPGSSVQVNSVAGQNQQGDMVLSLDSGMLETHYSLPAASDSVVTPDFRITLIGPGEFHVAIGADARGNTCVQPLAGNNAALIVNELMGNGSYQVKPNQGVYFPNGRIKDAVGQVPRCGCPPENGQRSVETAEAPRNTTAPQPPAEANPPLPNVTQPLPAGATDQVHVQVDAPMVFDASAAALPSVDTAQLVRMPLTRVRWLTEEEVVPPVPILVQITAPKPEDKPPAPKVSVKKKGFFGRLFAAIFGR